MKLLIYGINFAPELTGIGKYSGEMAEWFAAQGHEVKVVTAPPYYPQWKIGSGYRNNYSKELLAGVTVYRCPLFVPAEPRTLTRLLHLLSFASSSFFVLFRLLFWRPQVVFVVEPTLFCLPGARLYAWLTSAKLVLHVQDYEIDAMFGLGMISGEGGVIAKLMRSVEHWWMRRLDAVSTISHSMMQMAEKKGVDKDRIIFFPNWVNTNFITPEVDKQFYRKQWAIPAETKVVLYSGNMGKKQGLELVIEAANRLRVRSDIIFMMVGQGAAHADLEELSRSLGLTNVRFEPLQPFEQLPQLLALADVHLVIQKKGAADVVLPSKLTGILSAGGHSIITAEPDTELGLLVQNFPGIATLVEPESVGEVCSKLEQLLSSDTRIINTVARDYALQYLKQESVLRCFEADMEKLFKRG